MSRINATIHRVRARPLAQKLGNVLLTRHRRLCTKARRALAEIPDDFVEDVVISCMTAAHLIGATNPHSVGTYLRELAKWCYDKDLPPLNALVITERLGMAGHGYYKAPGCRNWHVDVRRCIACRDYPARIKN